jgi:hypothetical protein
MSGKAIFLSPFKPGGTAEWPFVPEWMKGFVIFESRLNMNRKFNTDYEVIPCLLAPLQIEMICN